MLFAFYRLQGRILRLLLIWWILCNLWFFRNKDEKFVLLILVVYFKHFCDNAIIPMLSFRRAREFAQWRNLMVKSPNGTPNSRKISVMLTLMYQRWHSRLFIFWRASVLFITLVFFSICAVLLPCCKTEKMCFRSNACSSMHPVEPSVPSYRLIRW